MVKLSSVLLLPTTHGLVGRELPSIPCWPLDGITAKVRVNASSDDTTFWLTFSKDKWIVATNQENLGIPLYFQAAQEDCNSYHLQNKFYNVNEWIASDGCGWVDAHSNEVDAQRVMVTRTEDENYVLSMGEQYLSFNNTAASPDCDYCPPNTLSATSVLADAMVVSLVEEEVVVTTTSTPGDVLPVGGGLVRCPPDQVAFLGAKQGSAACSDSCPEGFAITPPGMVCWPRLSLWLGNDMASPSVSYAARLDGVSTLTVTLPLPPKTFAEGVTPTFSVDIQSYARSVQANSGCHSVFQPRDDKIETPGDSGWFDQNHKEERKNTPLLYLEEPPTIHGWFAVGDVDWLEKTFAVPTNVPVRLSVSLYLQSTASADSMTVEINSQERFRATRAFWCPSPAFHPNQPCIMNCVIDVEDTSDGQIVVRIESSRGSWGFNKFHLAVPQLSADFSYDDFDASGRLCRLRQLDGDLVHSLLDGWVGVFTSDDSHIQAEHLFPLGINFPRLTSAYTDEEFRIWARSINGRLAGTAQMFHSFLSLFDAQDSTSSRSVASYKMGDKIWAWHNLSTANHTMEVQRVYLSTSTDFMDNSSQIGEDLVVIDHEGFSGSLQFSFRPDTECPEGCWVHVVSFLTPPEFGRRLQGVGNQDFGRRLDSHVLAEAHETVGELGLGIGSVWVQQVGPEDEGDDVGMGMRTANVSWVGMIVTMLYLWNIVSDVC